MSVIDGHTCIGDDGGTANRRCLGCAAERNPNRYPYLAPADAPEWKCPQCGCDALWCGHHKPDPSHVITYYEEGMINHQVCTFGIALDDFALEALERMTEGGLQVLHDVRHGVYFVFGEAFVEKRGCEHERTKPGPRVPARYGSWPSEICSDCGAQRTLGHIATTWSRNGKAA